MAERYLPAEAEQHVQPDADDRRQPDSDDDKDLIIVAARDQETDGGNRDCGGRRLQRAHTFLNCARPNSPFGRTASARMTSAKVTICVYVEPSSAVISASATP